VQWLLHSFAQLTACGLLLRKYSYTCDCESCSEPPILHSTVLKLKLHSQTGLTYTFTLTTITSLHNTNNCNRDESELTSNLNFNLAAAREAEAACNGFVTVINDFKQTRYTAWVDHLNTTVFESETAGGVTADGNRPGTGTSAAAGASAGAGSSSVAAGSGNDSSGALNKAATLAGKLDVPLLRRATIEDESEGGVKAGLLVCNFNQELLALFTEVSYWEKFQGEFRYRLSALYFNTLYCTCLYLTQVVVVQCANGRIVLSVVSAL
jgi:hypothetical protein